MSTNDDDLALQTLLAARAEVAPGLDPGLLKQCYEIQKKYQFSEDRTLSSTAMDRLIDSIVAKSPSVG